MNYKGKFLWSLLILLSFLLFAGKKQKEQEERLKQLEKENIELRSELEDLKARLDLLLRRIEKLEEICQVSSNPSPPSQGNSVSAQKNKPIPSLPVVKMEPPKTSKEKKPIVIKIEKASEGEKREKKGVRQQILKFIQAKDYKSAEDLAKSELAHNPEPKYSCWLLYHLASAQKELGKKESARDTFLKLADRYPACDYAPEALFRAGELWEELGNPEQAKKIYQEIISLYPFSDYANLSKKKLGK